MSDDAAFDEAERILHDREFALRAFIGAQNADDPDAVDDLVQITMFRFLQTMQRGDVVDPAAYLFGIARNVVREWRRRPQGESVNALIGTSREPSAPLSRARQFDRDVFGDDGETRQAVRQCLQELSDVDRELIICFYFEQDVQTTRQLADRLGLRVENVHVRLTRIRRRLRLCAEARLR